MKSLYCHIHCLSKTIKKKSNTTIKHLLLHFSGVQHSILEISSLWYHKGQWGLSSLDHAANSTHRCILDSPSKPIENPTALIFEQSAVNTGLNKLLSSVGVLMRLFDEGWLIEKAARNDNDVLFAHVTFNLSMKFGRLLFLDIYLDPSKCQSLK